MKYNLKSNIHDYIFSIISIFIVLLLILMSYLLVPKSSGIDYAIVRYNNEIVQRMPLDVDVDFVMHKTDYPDLYGDELVVSVRDKKVYISKEESPFHYCSYLGKIDKKGSSLICAPNCVRVTIEGHTEADIIL